MRKRHLDPRLKAWFETLLHPAIGPLPDAFAQGSKPNLLLFATASACVDVREEGAENRGRIVELIQSTLGVPHGEPWCAAFVQSCIAFVEEYSGVQSSIYPSESCMQMFANSSGLLSPEPAPGDIIVWRHEQTTEGHTGIIAEVLRTESGKIEGYKTIEGNTNSGARSIEREGDGIYFRTRPRGGVGKMAEVGILRAFSEKTSVAETH